MRAEKLWPKNKADGAVTGAMSSPPVVSLSGEVPHFTQQAPSRSGVCHLGLAKIEFGAFSVISEMA